MQKFDFFITAGFVFIIMGYIVTTVLTLILPGLNSNYGKSKLSLFSFTFAGCISLIFKAINDYSPFIILAFLIVYSLVYAAYWISFVKYQKFTEREVNKVIQKRREARAAADIRMEGFENRMTPRVLNATACELHAATEE